MTQDAKVKVSLPGKLGRINNKLSCCLVRVLRLKLHMFCSRAVTFLTVHPVHNSISIKLIGFFASRRKLLCKRTVALKAAHSYWPVCKNFIREAGAVCPAVSRCKIGNGKLKKPIILPTGKGLSFST